MKRSEKAVYAQHKPGYIYLIWEVGTNHYKIGKTVNLQRRLAQLQTGASGKLQIKYSIRVADMSRSESSLHRQFAHRRIRKNNEWFVFARTDAVVSAMRNLAVSHRPRPQLSRFSLDSLKVLIAIGMLLGLYMVFSPTPKHQQKPNQQHLPQQLKKLP